MHRSEYRTANQKKNSGSARIFLKSLGTALAMSVTEFPELDEGVKELRRGGNFVESYTQSLKLW